MAKKVSITGGAAKSAAKPHGKDSLVEEVEKCVNELQEMREGMEELVRKVERSDGFLKTGKNIAELAYKVNETIPEKTSLDDMVNAMFTCIALQFCNFGGEKVELKDIRDYMRKMQAKMLNTIEVHRRMKGGKK